MVVGGHHHVAPSLPPGMTW